jgi:hypothetical protein
MSADPNNLSELFAFYDERVKPLYSAIQSSNILPTETLFELNAAFDHLSRHWVSRFNEPEAEVIAKVYSHLKRSCLDIFKLKLKETLDLYRELLKIDLSLIDNGAFEKKLKQLVNEIKCGAQVARNNEARIKGSDRLYGHTFD